MKLSTVLLTSTLVAFLSACSSDSSSPAANTATTETSGTSEAGGNTVIDGNSDSTSALAGLWDFSTDEGTFGTDVLYTHFSNGIATVYDYQGDTFDEGENCYEILIYTIENLGNNQYNNGVFMFSAVVQNGNLIHTRNDVTSTYPLLTGLSTTDFKTCT